MDQYRLKKYISENPDAKLRDLVTKLLYDDIVELRITPGSKLNVNQIAASLGISRTPVAEAIGKLAEVGFVISRPGQSGNFVLDLSLPDMINLYRVRSAIECEAAALCAHSADDATVRELSMLADAFKDSVLRRDIRGMKDTDMPFHKMIIDACGNPYIIQSYNILLPKLTMYQSSMLEFIGRSGKPLDAQHEVPPHGGRFRDTDASAGVGAPVNGRPCGHEPQLHDAFRQRRRPVLHPACEEIRNR